MFEQITQIEFTLIEVILLTHTSKILPKQSIGNQVKRLVFEFIQMTKLYVVCWSNNKDIETCLKIGRLIFGPFLLQSMNYQSDFQRMGQGKKR